MQQAAICCGGWHFVQFYFRAIWCSTRFSSGAFTVSYLQPYFLPDTSWWIQVDNVCRQQSSCTNHAVTLGIIVAYKLIFMPYRIALYSTNYLALKFKFLINFVQESNTPSTSNRIPINWLHNTRVCSKRSLSSSIGNVEAKLVRSHWTAMYLDQSVIVGMLYRQIYSWADSNTLLLIYCTCIRPHLKCACQLWDPFSNKYSHWKLCKNLLVKSSCLKRWDLDYDSMLQVFSLPHLSVHREYMHHISYTHVAFVINDMDFIFKKILKINTKTGLQQIACTRWS